MAEAVGWRVAWIWAGSHRAERLAVLHRVLWAAAAGRPDGDRPGEGPMVPLMPVGSARPRASRN